MYLSTFRTREKKSSDTDFSRSISLKSGNRNIRVIRLRLRSDLLKAVCQRPEGEQSTRLDVTCFIFTSSKEIWGLLLVYVIDDIHNVCVRDGLNTDFGLNDCKLNDFFCST
jgi:hypothetical protein